LVSGYATEVVAQQGAGGEFALLNKPYRQAELLHQVAAMTAEAHAVQART
jgi:hypothetical protein